MNKEFIERGQVVNALGHRIQELTNESFVRGMNEALSIAEEFVRRIPAADVVEVVRCNECRWRGSEDCAMFYECDCGEQHTWETDNDFCSYGERMSDNAKQSKT